MVSGLQKQVGSIKAPGTYPTTKVVSGVIGKGGGVYAPTGENLSTGEVSEEQAKQILQKQIEERQAGRTGYVPEGGYLSMYKTEEPQVQTQTQIQPTQAQLLQSSQIKPQTFIEKVKSTISNIFKPTQQVQPVIIPNNFQAQPKDYSAYYANPFIQKYISPPDKQGVSLIRREKEIPQIFKTYTGDVFAQYKTGPRILIDQGQSFLPPDIAKEQAKAQLGLSAINIWKPEYQYESTDLFRNIKEMQERIKERIKIEPKAKIVSKFEETIQKPIQRLREFEIAKALEKQDILNKYNSGQPLTFLERQKISDVIRTEQLNKERLEWEIKERQEGRIGTQPSGGFLTGVPTDDRIFKEKAGIFKGLLETPSYPVRKYFEIATSRFTKEGKFVRGVQFYGKGEQEKIIQNILKEFSEAKDYESQQRAIENLRSKGVNVILKNNEYVVDTSNIVPTSRIGNIIVGATDVFFKGALFSPLIEAGATKKTTTTAKVVEKAPQKSAEKLLQKAEELFKAGKLEGELYKLNKLATTETAKANLKVVLDDLYSRGLIKGFYQDVNTGKFILLDSSGKMIIPEITKSAPKLTIDFDVTELANIPRIKSIPQITAGVSMFSRNKFEGTAPVGRIETFNVGMESIGELGRFKDLRILASRLDVSQKVRQETIQKAIQKERQQEALLNQFKQQEVLKQPVKSALGLSSLLKSQQAQAQRYKQIQQQQFKQPQRFKQPQQQKFPKPILIPRLKRIESRIGKGKNKLGIDIFTIELRRKGKFQPIAKAKDIGSALQIGKTEARQTLGASIRIRKGEELLRLIPTQEFRKSKSYKDPFSIIQIPQARLSSQEERRAIVQARRGRWL